MGTRADFYSGGTDPATMVWLGSIAWDGYPDGLPSVLLRHAPDEATWVLYVATFLGDRPDATLPRQGWPWPWDDSRVTDYAYTWTEDTVLVSNFGNEWFAVDDDERTPVCAASFPDMAEVKNVTWGERSGVIVLGRLPEKGTDD